MVILCLVNVKQIKEVNIVEKGRPHGLPGIERSYILPSICL